MLNKNKILNLIFKWKYLSNNQITRLSNLKQPTVSKNIKKLVEEKLVVVYQFGNYRYYYLTQKGYKFLGINSKKSKINWNEYLHQNLMVEFVYKNKLSIDQYELFTEKNSELFWIEEFKSFMPDLVYWKDNFKKERVLVEIERSKKSHKRLNDKLDKITPFIEKGDKIQWITDNDDCFRYLERYFNEFGFKSGSELIQIKNNML